MLNLINYKRLLNNQSKELIPANVKQQIQLWENELNSLEVTKGILIEFDNS